MSSQTFFFFFFLIFLMFCIISLSGIDIQALEGNIPTAFELTQCSFHISNNGNGTHLV